MPDKRKVKKQVKRKPPAKKPTAKKTAAKPRRRTQRGRGRVGDFIQKHPYLSAAGGILGSALLAGLGGAAYGHYGQATLELPPGSSISSIDHDFSKFEPLYKPKPQGPIRSSGIVMPIDFNEYSHADWFESF